MHFTSTCNHSITRIPGNVLPQFVTFRGMISGRVYFAFVSRLFRVFSAEKHLVRVIEIRFCHFEFSRSNRFDFDEFFA